MLGKLVFNRRKTSGEFCSTKFQKQDDSENHITISQDVDDHPDSFFKSTKPIILPAQMFGILINVHGMTGKNHTYLYFELRSWKTIYTLALMVGASFLFICNILGIHQDGITFYSSAAIVFGSAGLLNGIIFIKIAKHWPLICKEFYNVEMRFQNYGYPPRFALKLKLLAFAFLIVALVEHLLSYTQSLQFVLAKEENHRNHKAIAEIFFRLHFYSEYRIFEYANWKTALLLYINVVSTFWWSYNDLFLSIMSICITSKIELFNKAIFEGIGQVKSPKYWNQARENYNSLYKLTKKVDDSIGVLMFVSLGNNLYFICLQLFRVLKHDINAHGIALIYFHWSFAFLLLRTLLVAYSAASLHESSKEITEVIYSIPKEGYSEEVERLSFQVHNDAIALTGWKFFSVKKTFILKIAGTVMTYEIFCVQLFP